MSPLPIRHYLPVNEGGQFRQVCLTEYGPPKPQETILCLPGLLETATGWADFANYFAQKHTVYVIDFAGRGLSTHLTDRAEYKMSSCLADICSAIAFINGRHQQARGKKFIANSMPYQSCLHVVGNSMGGLLAVTLAAAEPMIVTSIVINDVAAVIPWAGLIALMGGIYNTGIRSNESITTYSLAALARSLDVDPRLLRAVMRPSYADLDLKQTLQGMSYEKYFSKILAPMLLVHSSESQLVTPKVIEATQLSKKIEVFSVPGDDHPVPYSTELNKKIEAFILQSQDNPQDASDEPDQAISDWFNRFKGKKFL